MKKQIAKRNTFERKSNRGIRTRSNRYIMAMMDPVVHVSMSRKALITSGERWSLDTPTSPLNPRIRQNRMNRVWRSHRYLLSAMNRIRGLLKRTILVLCCCIDQNYSISSVPGLFYTNGARYYTKRVFLYLCFFSTLTRL